MYYYLELQSEHKNGWDTLGHMGSDVLSVWLEFRFGAEENAGFVTPPWMFDIDSVKDSKEFRSVLGYINNDKDKQMKGEGGSAK